MYNGLGTSGDLDLGALALDNRRRRKRRRKLASRGARARLARARKAALQAQGLRPEFHRAGRSARKSAARRHQQRRQELRALRAEGPRPMSREFRPEFRPATSEQIHKVAAPTDFAPEFTRITPPGHLEVPGQITGPDPRETARQIHAARQAARHAVRPRVGKRPCPPTCICPKCAPLRHPRRRPPPHHDDPVALMEMHHLANSIYGEYGAAMDDAFEDEAAPTLLEQYPLILPAAVGAIVGVILCRG